MNDVPVNVEYFAQARAAAGNQSRETIRIAAGTALDDVVRQIARAHGERMTALLLMRNCAVSPSIIVAVDGVQVSPGNDVRLRGGETIMIMPPISGGQP